MGDILTLSSPAVILEPQIIPLQQRIGLNLKKLLEESFRPSPRQPVLWLDGLLWSYISLFRDIQILKNTRMDLQILPPPSLLSPSHFRHQNRSIMRQNGRFGTGLR